MMYRQSKVADESVIATTASLKIKGKWIPGRILDKKGNHLPFPCQVWKGETYIVEVDDSESE